MQAASDLIHLLETRFSHIREICDSISQQIGETDRSKQSFMLLLADLKNELNLIEVAVFLPDATWTLLQYLRSVNVNITPQELYILHFGNVEQYKQKAFKGNITSIIEVISAIKASISLWETRVFPSFNVIQGSTMQSSVPVIPAPPLASDDQFEWDAFICHASEDKETFVRELCRRLTGESLKIWYDEFSLKVGDSLRESIEKGLVNSRFGIVVLSQAFIQKDWPQRELSALYARDSRNSSVILPIWLDLNSHDIASNFPLLADRFATKAQDGMDKVVSDIVGVLRQ